MENILSTALLSLKLGLYALSPASPSPIDKTWFYASSNLGFTSWCSPEIGWTEERIVRPYQYRNFIGIKESYVPAYFIGMRGNLGKAKSGDLSIGAKYREKSWYPYAGISIKFKALRDGWIDSRLAEKMYDQLQECKRKGIPKSDCQLTR